MGEDTAADTPPHITPQTLAEQICTSGPLEQQLDLLTAVMVRVAQRHRLEEHKFTFMILLRMPYRGEIY